MLVAFSAHVATEKPHIKIIEAKRWYASSFPTTAHICSHDTIPSTPNIQRMHRDHVPSAPPSFSSTSSGRRSTCIMHHPLARVAAGIMSAELGEDVERRIDQGWRLAAVSIEMRFIFWRQIIAYLLCYLAVSEE
ncbi:hypothetical protein H0H81_008856 [Sphagnurus paluster]|uniref:Uncharacterized protein n=1 Tax=Sphagnurus paluster TaxID=117069 RepID=A0A9P7KK56_9AGAR|nr:hypothetical protein H0H81_008856 [Sphagnurus paluster]